MQTGTVGRTPTHEPAGDAALAETAAALIQARRTVLPRRLDAPGPDRHELQAILEAAAAAPDHGQLLPWRFVVVPQQARWRLAEAFAASLRERDPDATEEQLQQAREKAHRAPLLLLAVGRTGADGDLPVAERVLSAGCAIQNMLLMATALGYGSALTSGKALRSAPLRQLFQLAPEEEALCFISMGTTSRTPSVRPRPDPSRFVSELVLHS